MARITPSQAKANRIARQAARKEATAIRKAKRESFRNGLRTVASHLRHMGLDEDTASGIASTLRKKVSGPGIKGFSLKYGVRRECTRYAQSQLLAALIIYKPRKAEYKDARAFVLTQLLDLTV